MKAHTYRGQAWCEQCGPIGQVWAYSEPDLAAKMSAANWQHKETVHGDPRGGERCGAR